MLVGERMSHPVITIAPDLPVVRDGQLVGIVSDKDLLNASPSTATSLSVWEMNYLLTKITVRDVMTREVLTVTEDTAIEQAARIMVDNKIGGLPVMRGEAVVGIITETDLFKILLEMTGARQDGVRVTAFVHERRGQLAKLTKAIFEAGGNFVAFVQFSDEDASNRLITFKVAGMPVDLVKQVVGPLVENLVDVRECC